MQLKFASFISILLTLIPLSVALEQSSTAVRHQPRDTSDEDRSFELSVGVRMKRDEDSSSSLHKRSDAPSSTELHLQRDPETGKFVWPSSFGEAVAMAKRDIPALKSSLYRRAKKTLTSVIITWYSGEDLKNPSCFSDEDNWAPTDESMAAAVTIEWANKPKCGEFVKIFHHHDPNKFIIVRVVDACAGCESGSAHIDLTKAAFEKLYDEDIGKVEGLKAVIIPPPVQKKHWSEVVHLYGPRKTMYD